MMDGEPFSEDESMKSVEAALKVLFETVYDHS